MAVPSDHDIVSALGEDLPVGIWIARAPDGEFVYANRMFADLMGPPRPDAKPGGYARAYGIHTRDGALYPEGKLPFARAIAERCVIVADDLMVRRRDGRQVELRAIARPVGDPITHVVVVFFDVSREATAAPGEAEPRLRHTQRLEAVGTLAGGIAHDFNKLIFGMRLIAAELMATEREPRRRAVMEQLDDVTERTAALTRSFLGLGPSGTPPAVPVSVNDLVTSMAELLGRTLPGVDLAFELEATDGGTVIGDHAQLERVLINLVLNARDAVEGAGRVVVRTADRDAPRDAGPARFVVLEVKDDGPEVSPETRARVCKLCGTAKPPGLGSGSGVGLWTVFGIVERHGGTVEADVGLAGRGTTMRVVLPAAPRPPAVMSGAVAVDPPKLGTLILIVDDDPMVRKVVAGTLDSLGYQTLEAVSGANAIEIYRARHAEIRAVVLDMVMPDMPGKATYLALRQVDDNVAVLLMTGHMLNAQVQELLDLGVRSYLSKPYSIAELAAAVDELIR